MEEKTYFYTGDEVQIKQNLDFKPTMVVKEIAKSSYKKGDAKSPVLRGIRCFWYDANMSYNEALFSSKDLIKLNSYAQNNEV